MDNETVGRGGILAKVEKKTDIDYTRQEVWRAMSGDMRHIVEEHLVKLAQQGTRQKIEKKAVRNLTLYNLQKKKMQCYPEESAFEILDFNTLTR